MANTRRHPRIGPLLLKADFAFEERVGRAYVTNLSTGGAFLACRETIPIGSSIRLFISLPWGLGSVEVFARVVWRRAESGPEPASQSCGAGVEFTELDPEVRSKIEAYLRRFHELAASLPSSMA